MLTLNNIIISIISIIIISSISFPLNGLKVSSNIFVIFKKLVRVLSKGAI